MENHIKVDDDWGYPYFSPPQMIQVDHPWKAAKGCKASITSVYLSGFTLRETHIDVENIGKAMGFPRGNDQFEGVHCPHLC